jgi:hypothetical protein
MATTDRQFVCLEAAGRRSDLLASKRPIYVGCGNANSNLVHSTALLGIEPTYIDPDRVMLRNLPHSPFLEANPGPDGLLPYKAEQLAKAHVRNSRASVPIAHWAAVPLQAVGLGLLRQFDGAIVGVDDGPSRAWAVNTFSLLGIPTIVAGLWPPTGNFITLGHQDPEAACYFCIRPDEKPTRSSCSLYSGESNGVNPALQTAAAALMNVALEALIMMWHGDERYAQKVFRLDVSCGEASLTGFRRNPDCERGHERYSNIEPIDISPDGPAQAVFEQAYRDGFRAPQLSLPSTFYQRLPCRRCGAPIEVMRPDWAVSTAPTCDRECQADKCESPSVVSVSSIKPESSLAALSLRQLGLGPRALCVVQDDASDLSRIYELQGAFADVFHTVTRDDIR